MPLSTRKHNGTHTAAIEEQVNTCNENENLTHISIDQ